MALAESILLLNSTAFIRAARRTENGNGRIIDGRKPYRSLCKTSKIQRSANYTVLYGTPKTSDGTVYGTVNPSPLDPYERLREKFPGQGLGSFTFSSAVCLEVWVHRQPQFTQN
ncbi:hypothetical protein BT96DRAFT_934316 [Gymnopus androsaceus JB14]|uniref:Uncharacterized protein n=1 Tax=Gymnopus androsaceus JB14 TaxID=1447944 RepID=A0A6A4I6I1_9AGAR|nr:hypothetical protein BT96DRAFT_934316 [Gymnopus androsaceus JB14]